jgi:hypothetical protein
MIFMLRYVEVFWLLSAQVAGHEVGGYFHLDVPLLSRLVPVHANALVQCLLCRSLDYLGFAFLGSDGINNIDFAVSSFDT